MFFHTVIKWIYCEPCEHLIKVKKYSTTQGADTPEDKAYQDRLIEAKINNHTLLGFHICPKCKHKAIIIDPIVDPLPPYQPDKAKVKANYEAILKMESIEPDTKGTHPTFDQFYEYSRKCRVQAWYDKRTLKGFTIAGDNFKRDYTFIPKASHP